MASPDSVLRGLSRGMSRLHGLVETEVADHLVDLDDDVLGDFGLHGFAIYHLDKGDALVIGLCDRYCWLEGFVIFCIYYLEVKTFLFIFANGTGVKVFIISSSVQSINGG